MDEIIQITEASSLEAINRSEIDMQIATAKRYPRDLEAVLNEIKTIAAHDVDTAAECFYCLKRQDNVIEGVSVRMAEIIAGAWGNIRVASRVIGNDGKVITAQAVCIDLQKNVAVSTEVKRSILTKNGTTYSQDMQVVTGNAACSIAFRNAVLKVIPKAVIKSIIDEVKKVSLGQLADIETMRKGIMEWYYRHGVNGTTILEFLEIDSMDEMTNDMLLELRGISVAINEHDATIQSAILDVIAERKAAEAAAKKATTAADKVAKAMAKK